MGIADAAKKLLGIGGEAPDTEKWMAERFQSLKSAFLVYHLKIWESILFYAGETWITLDENSKIYRTEVPQDDWVPTPRINRFSPAIDSIASNYMVPEVEAVPTKTGDPNGQSIANICTKLAQYAIRNFAIRSDYQNDEDKAGMAEKCFVLAGCAFTEVVCDKKIVGQKPITQMAAGIGVQCLDCDKYFQGTDPQQVAPNGVCPQCGGSNVQYSRPQIETPVMGEDGQPQTEPIYDFPIKVVVGNPLYALPRPGSTSMANSYPFFWAERLTVDEIYERWSDRIPKGTEIHPDSVYLDGFSTTYQNSLNYFYAGYSSNTTQEKDACMVIRAFAPPGKMRDYPKGLHALYINEQLIFEEDWDFPDHPFTKFDYLQIPTLFFPRSVAFDLVPLQRELQSYEALIKLHAMTSAVDPIILDENTIVTQPTGRADKIVKWRSIGPGSKEPHRMQHGTLDDGVYRQRDALHAEFENVSGAVAVWKGRQEGAITAASAIQQLRSQAELMFSKPTINWNNGWKETVRKCVKFIQKYWSIQKLAEILGEDLLTDIQNFKASNLDTDVEFVSSQHGLPRTRDEQRQEMVVMFDKGILDLRDVNVRRKAFELFGETGMLKTFNANATRARMENEIIKGGGQATFRPGIEDSDIHSQIHKEAVISLDFDRWSPEAQATLIKHIQETDLHLADVAQTAAAIGAPKKGKEDGEETPTGGPEDDGRFAVPTKKATEAPRRAM